MSVEEAGLPDNVVIDVHGDALEGTDNRPGKKSKPRYQMKLFFKCSCPEVPEVQRLHPAIKNVFRPKRKKNMRYCILQFNNADACEQVRSALHKKHIEPYPGKLWCTTADSDVIKQHRDLISDLPETGRVSQLDVRHLKRITNPNNKITEDVKMNSTARELFIRYGVHLPLSKKKVVTEQSIDDEVTEVKSEEEEEVEEDDLSS